MLRNEKYMGDALLQKTYKMCIRDRLIAVLELAVLGILWHAGQVLYAYAVYTGICITALFMLVGKAQLWIQSHTENG